MATTELQTPPLRSTKVTRAKKAKERLTSPGATAAAIVIALIWTVPIIGLFMTSLRPGALYRTTPGGLSSLTVSSL